MNSNNIKLTPNVIKITLSKETKNVSIENNKHSSIKLQPKTPNVTISKTLNSPNIKINKTTEIIKTITSSSPKITLSRLGAQGPRGPSGGGGEGSLSWIDVAGDVEYTELEIEIASGLVSECDYRGSTIYRFESTAENSRGYLVEDSFYSDFDGANLTNLIVRRNT